SSGKSEIELAEFGKSFLKIYKCALENYSNKKKLRNYLDFEDILLLTHKIISLSTVQTYLHEKYKYIMIDEYQDTNELQYDIFMPILDNLQLGNLFVVGDEKQSIYMFRDAELEVFNKTKQEIVKTAEHGSNLSLPHSFRMFPHLVLFTNTVFKNLFVNPQKEFNEVPHSDLVCTKFAGDIGNVGILLADTSREIEESEIVAGKIVDLIKNDETLSFGDIAILCRKRKYFSELETSLVKYGVPYVIMGGKGFYQRQTIYDVYNYISFLINPKDDQALIGVLRSPFYNLSDSKLLKISLETGESFYDKLRTLAKSDARIKPIVSSIEKNINGIVSSEPYSLIRKILNESGYWAVLASKKNSEQEIANVEKLLALSRAYSGKGFKNLYDFTIALKEFIEGYEDEGQAQVSQDQNAVKLMTIHQSKGLEFMAVYVYGTNSKAQEDNVKARTLSISKEFGLLTKVPIDKKYFSKYAISPIAAFHNFKVKKKNQAELKRLLYVAVTRAIKHLYISATHKEYKPVAGSFYNLLCDGLRNDFQTENIYLAADVEFMLQQENAFVNKKKRVELNISIEKERAEVDLPANEKNTEIVQKLLRNQKIDDSPKHEIISATKISMYTQCPVKYELTYDIGFLPVLNLIKRQESVYEFQPNEEVESIKQFAQLRGSIIHKCLSESIEIEKLSDYINNLLLAETNEKTVKLSDSIKNDIQNYYKSKTYDELNSCPDSKNEYEVYCQEGEFYLYGIIDKLIVESGKLIVVDYKTDSVEKEKLNNRAENYFPQLRFYSYVLSKLFKEVTDFELRLVFIKHPDELVTMSLTKHQVEEYGDVIRSAIKNIHSNNFIPNLEHCKHCQFALEGDKCVKSI
ncbi:MAG: 3'-5' exonuclease, partial [Ignavibacteria bacterium]|nr:3'-5' exonuclease [Ignavibacteria bacterium]